MTLDPMLQAESMSLFSHFCVHSVFAIMMQFSEFHHIWLLVEKRSWAQGVVDEVNAKRKKKVTGTAIYSWRGHARSLFSFLIGEAVE